MDSPTIACPKCGTPIEINAALAKDVEARIQITYNERLKKEQAESRRQLDAQNESHLRDVEKIRAEVAKAEAAKAREKLDTQLKALTEQIAEQGKELAEGRKRETEFLKLKRDLEKKAVDAELVAARKLEEERKKIAEEAVRTSQEQYELRLRQKEVEAEGLRKQVQEMDRKLAQGSQQTQGEAQERALEEALGDAFPGDEIVAIKSGAQGADILQKVRTPGGEVCGSILWETKAAKKWGSGWPEKLKTDQLREKADVAVLVSRELPETVIGFGEVEGIWVGTPELAIPLAAVTREGIMRVHRANKSQEGRVGKESQLFAYVQSPEFRQQVQLMADALWEMRLQIEGERRAFEKQWRMRDKQVQQAMLSIVGIYGSMQGVLGTAMSRINHLELPSGEE